MGTRSRIAVMHGDKCKSVYCHWDGYLEHNGKILHENYNSSKANHLVALGDISSLGKVIGEAHPFSQFEIDKNDPDFDKLIALYEQADSLGWTTFYGRDRGETGVDFAVDLEFDKFIERVENCGGEWYYIMRDDVWYVGNTYSRDTKFYRQLVPLAEALATVDEEA